MRAWFQGSLGSQVSEVERAELGRILPNLFGYHLLQVSSVGPEDLVASSRITHRVVMGLPGAPAQLYAAPEALPALTDSLDVVVLHHTLEFAADARQVLREVDRTLIPEGHVVIVGFNPWSAWGLRRAASHWKGQAPWRGRFLSLVRLKDWLALLGFDTIATHTCFYRPPLARQGLMRRLEWMERLGERRWPLPAGIYLLVAKKRVVALTPIRPRWRPRRSLIAAGVVRPTTRA